MTEVGFEFLNQLIVAIGFFCFGIYAIFFTDKFKERNRANGLKLYKITGLKMYKKGSDEALDQSSLYIRLFATIPLILSLFIFSELIPNFSLYSIFDISPGTVFMMLWSAGAILGGGYMMLFYIKTQTGRAKELSIMYGVFFLLLGLWNLWNVLNI